VPEEKGWKLEDTVAFSRALAVQGAIDLIDISTGGVHVAQKVISGVNFQVVRELPCYCSDTKTL
jgi:2,4-dienoyl-CoA reductase-like NADH-dependent reductase (Old Yellow Enzyme family)